MTNILKLFNARCEVYPCENNVLVNSTQKEWKVPYPQRITISKQEENNNEIFIVQEHNAASVLVYCIALLYLHLYLCSNTNIHTYKSTCIWTLIIHIHKNTRKYCKNASNSLVLSWFQLEMCTGQGFHPTCTVIIFIYTCKQYYSIRTL